MRRAAVGALGFLAACATPADSSMTEEPTWRGPAVHCRHLGDRGLEVELVAPTAGHAFELVAVRSEGHRAEVDLVHRLPAGDAFVAQVVTSLRVQIGPERLGTAKVVSIRIVPPFADSAIQIALVTARP